LFPGIIIDLILKILGIFRTETQAVHNLNKN